SSCMASSRLREAGKAHRALAAVEEGIDGCVGRALGGPVRHEAFRRALDLRSLTRSGATESEVRIGEASRAGLNDRARRFHALVSRVASIASAVSHAAFIVLSVNTSAPTARAISPVSACPANQSRSDMPPLRASRGPQ